ncbi:extracellular electron transfer flavoprotein PplA [Lederbergia panacisoli]|uniref:extracellular electron transfer flavoprotein PplA n=1 Tax=Lederbergia panacisoli TaxID=1255251 RepID=UPI00214AF57D|nr:extracellular electron transfer flavoprotein PplA [Lederbergia panacisoli]MCR2820126.1 FMN-binding protein [Lederbergia panacisoli]
MKKMPKLLTVVASVTLLLGACGTSATVKKDEGSKNANASSGEAAVKVVAGAELQDGTYSLKEKDFDDHGWKASMGIVVKDGKITESSYNYEDEKGTLKSEDEGYQKSMSEKTGVGPKEFIPQLNEALVKSQDAQKVDVVTGATHSSETFLNYAQQLVQAAQNGDTATIEIDTKASLKDGEYSLAEKNIGSTGWKTFINMTVKDGKITASDYNYLNKDGDLKTNDEGYQEKMTEKTGTGPQDYIPALNNALVDTQNPAEVDVVTGATHSSHTFKMYAAQLINAAQKGDTSKIEVDNYVYSE